MSKQLGLGRRALLAMLRQTRADVHRSPDLDSNEVGPGGVWAGTVGMHIRPEIFCRSTYRPVRGRRCIPPRRMAKEVEPLRNAARAACEVQVR